MTLPPARGPTDGAVPESAHRGLAVFFGWLGAFAPGEALFIILGITSNYDPLIGSAVNMVIIGVVLSGMMATVVCMGSALAVFYQSRVVKRHAMRLNTATVVAGGVSSLVCIGLLQYSWELKAWDDYTAFIAIAIIISAAITFGVLEVLLRKKMILPPLPSLCHHCGYPIGTSPVCTECGRPVTHFSRDFTAANGFIPESRELV